jgi:predicted acyltransferase
LRGAGRCCSIGATGGPAIATADAIVEAAPRVSAAAPAAAATRLVALDVFRGATIAGMILVNDPGSWSAIYWPLEHAPWHGWTPTDLIFPFFLFIVGVSMTLSFASRAKKGVTRAALARHVAWRSLLISAIGLFMAAEPYFRMGTVRIPGVLQRIAVCYLISGLFVLGVWREPERSENDRRLLAPVAALIVFLLVGYWAAMTFIPVPGYGVGRLDPDGNLGAYIDRKVMGAHLWSQSKTWDPEGIMSTFPAIATTLTGVLVGLWLRSRRTPQMKVAGMLTMGAAGLVAGELLHPFFPINKNLWTSTYVIFTSGFAIVLLALCYWAVDIRGWRRWATPFVIFGTNAIAVFTFSGLLAKASVIYKVTRADGRQVTWHSYVYNKLFVPFASPINASLLFAVSYVLLWFFLMWLLYRKRIFIKI